MTTLLHRRLIANQYGLKILGGGGRVPPRWREEGTSCMDPAVHNDLGTRIPMHSFPPHTGSHAALWQDWSLHFLLEQCQSSWVTSIDRKSVGWRNGRHCRFLSSCNSQAPRYPRGAGNIILTCAAQTVPQERPRFGFCVSFPVFPFSFSMLSHFGPYPVQ